VYYLQGLLDDDLLGRLNLLGDHDGSLGAMAHRLLALADAASAIAVVAHHALAELGALRALEHERAAKLVALNEVHGRVRMKGVRPARGALLAAHVLELGRLAHEKLPGLIHLVLMMMMMLVLLLLLLGADKVGLALVALIPLARQGLARKVRAARALSGKGLLKVVALNEHGLVARMRQEEGHLVAGEALVARALLAELLRNVARPELLRVRVHHELRLWVR